MTLQELSSLAGERCHLAILTEPYLSLLLAGQKMIESRWMKHKIAPYGQAQTGDLVYVKKSSGPVMASFRVGWMKEGTLDVMLPLAVKHQAAICVNDAYLIQIESTGKRFGVLMEVLNLRRLPDFDVQKPGMSGWVVLPMGGASHLAAEQTSLLL